MRLFKCETGHGNDGAAKLASRPVVKMMDQSKKAALIQFIKEQQKSGKEEILLSPAHYFDGYNDEHCTICANNSSPVACARFLGRLNEVGQRSDVSAVYVRFYDYLDAEDSEDLWISSDSVYISTSTDAKAVKGWFADFEVSDAWVEDDPTKFAGLSMIPSDHRLIAAWWD